MMRTLARWWILPAAVLGLGLLPSAGRADLLIVQGNNPQPGEENVLLNNGTSGHTVVGLTNQSGTPVDFTYAAQVLTEPANGQARIQAANGSGAQIALTGIDSISLEGGHTFQDIIFNEHIGGGFGARGNTTITVNGKDSMGNAESASGTFAIANGENFFTITASNGQTITSVGFSSPNGIADLRQVRISGISGVKPVPEPSSILLSGMGMGLVGLFGMRRYLRRGRELS
jgi:hypothetical protein